MICVEKPAAVSGTQLELPTPPTAAPWPEQAELVLSAIEAGQFTRNDRRALPRATYRVQAFLRLFSDQPGTPIWQLYTRDVNHKGLGFITPHRLPLGYGGMLEIVTPDGVERTIACTLLRCREAAPGWFDGALYFNRSQQDFAV